MMTLEAALEHLEVMRTGLDRKPGRRLDILALDAAIRCVRERLQAADEGERYEGGIRTKTYRCIACQDGGRIPPGSFDAHCPECGGDCLPF